MRISIDIDGTIAKTGEIIGKKKAIYLKERNIKEEEFNDSKELWLDFYEEYMESIVRKVELKDGFLEVFQELSKNNKISIVTARSNNFVKSLIEMEKITKEWLDKNNIKYDKYYGGCYGDGKVKACLDYKTDIMIDDDLNNCSALREAGIKTLLFDDFERYNNIEDRVSSWKEVLNYIEKLNN